MFDVIMAKGRFCDGFKRELAEKLIEMSDDNHQGILILCIRKRKPFDMLFVSF